MQAGNVCIQMPQNTTALARRRLGARQSRPRGKSGKASISFLAESKIENNLSKLEKWSERSFKFTEDKCRVVPSAEGNEAET